MRCSHCQTPMQVTELINERKTEQTRYHCSVCGHEHLQTQPAASTTTMRDSAPSSGLHFATRSKLTV